MSVTLDNQITRVNHREKFPVEGTPAGLNSGVVRGGSEGYDDALNPQY